MAHIEDSIRSGELDRYQPIFDTLERVLAMTLTDEQRQQVAAIMQEYERKMDALDAEVAHLDAELARRSIS